MGCAVSYEKTTKKTKDATAFHSPNTTRRLIEKTPSTPISRLSNATSTGDVYSSSASRIPWSPNDAASTTHLATPFSSSSSNPRDLSSPAFASSFTEQEIRAYNDTYLRLVNEGWMDRISERELLLTVMNCKLDTSLAVTKYKTWLTALKDVGFNSFEDVWRGISSNGKTGGEWKNLSRFLRRYAACGHDMCGRIVFWVRPNNEPIHLEDEGNFIKAVITYFVALHADIDTLREGITVVIDTSEKTTKHANEARLRRIINTMPARPQRIFILGAGYMKRMLINAMIKIVSKFSLQKIAARITFADLDDVRKEIPHDSMPCYVGGGYRISENDHLLTWVRYKLAEFPTLRSDISNSSPHVKDNDHAGSRPSENIVLSYPCGNFHCVYCDATKTKNGNDENSKYNKHFKDSKNHLGKYLWVYSAMLAVLISFIFYHLHSLSHFLSIQSTSKGYPFDHDLHMIDRFMTSSSSSNLIVDPEYMCVSGIKRKCTLVVSMGSVINNNLSHLGGTKHWYHLLQKILPSLEKAYDDIWSSKARSRFASNEDIYIVFEEESSVRHLTPFGRFLLTSLLTGGQFSRIHFAYYISNGTKQSLEVMFSVDLSQQGIDELFVVSAGLTEIATVAIESADVEELLHVNLVAPRTKFHWFLNEKKLLQFRESYSSLCDIDATVFGHVENLTKMDDLGKANFHDSTLDVLANSAIDIENDSSPHNIFRSARLRKLKPSAIEPSLRNIIVYQRDKGRYIQDIDMVWAKLTGQMMGWEVKILHHNESIAPCRLIKSVSTATVMLTSHGFQSILLLYQPWVSMLAEIHTHMLYIPHFYGELQISLRQKFGIARSYFSEESIPTHTLPSILSKVGIENGQSCKNRKYCRHLSKRQNVIVSDQFLDRIENFVRAYYYLDA